MFASSSRTLLGRSCRRRCLWPLSSSQSRSACADPSIRALADARHHYLQNSQSHVRVSFSTIPFDGSAFGSNVSPSSSGAVDDQVTYSKQSPTQIIKPIATQPPQGSPASQEFEQQIRQWVSTNPKIAPYKAEESLARLWVEQQDLFQHWEQQQQHQQQTHKSLADASPSIVLTTESVNLVLQAWCHSNNGEIAAERAERLLHWMEDLHSPESTAEGSASWSSFLPKPNYQSYATVIEAWSRSAVYESSHPSPSPRDATSGFSEKESKEGGRAKNNAISAATKAGFECAKRAEDVLMHMQRMHEKQLQVSNVKGTLDQYSSEIQPDTRVFNLVLKAWSNIRGGTKASAIRAMRILDLMQELHHVQSLSAPKWQGIVLSKVQPNLQTYKLVLHAWAHAAHTAEGPDRAEEILRHLLSLSKAGNLGVEIMPDVECFHIVMKAHAESVRNRRKGDDGAACVERAQKATALLDWMELLALRSSKIRPTTESYRIALSAWAWSHHVDAPKEAESILYRMTRASDANSSRDANIADGGNGDASTAKDHSDSLVRPEVRDFNTVINCCSFARKVGADKSEEDDESLLQRQLAHMEIFGIARGVLDALLSSPYAQPDSATFSGIIRACLNLLPDTDDRDERVIELFKLAYQTPLVEDPSSARITSTSSERMRAPPGAGCVDANVLRQLRHALPSTEDYIRVREEFEDYRRQSAGEQ